MTQCSSASSRPSTESNSPISTGEALRDAGMELAAENRGHLIASAQVAFLNAILSNPERTATTDDIGGLAEKRALGGNWLGTVPVGLARRGLIERTGYKPSVRKHRHAAPVAIWRAVVSDAQLVAARDAMKASLSTASNAAQVGGEVRA